MSLNHFSRSAGVLTFGVIIEIAPAERREMKQRGETDQGNKKRVTQRRRRQRRRINQRIFDRKCAGAGGHGADSLGRFRARDGIRARRCPSP